MARVIELIRRNPGVVYTLFWVVVLIVLFHHLGGGSLRMWDEGLTAERSREMLETQQWLTPQLNGSPDFNKPPLYYWLTAATMAVFGRNEFAVRLWSVLFGIGCLVVVTLVAKRETGSRWIGHLAAFLLITTPYWTGKTREGLLDSGMMFGLIGALALLHYGSSTRSAMAAGFAATASALIKGPVVLIIFLLHPIVWRWSARGRYDWKRWATALTVCFVAGGWWYIAMIVMWKGAFIDQYIGHNLVARATSDIEGRTGGALYYIIKWPSLAPLSAILALVALITVYTKRRTFLPQSSVWIALWLLSFIAIEATGSKRELYLYPVMTLTAIVAPVALHYLAADWPQLRRGVAAIILTIIATVGLFTKYDATPNHSRGAKEIALRWQSDASHFGPVACFNRPPHLFSFYLNRIVPYAHEIDPAKAYTSYFLHEDDEADFLNQAKKAKIRVVRSASERDYLLYRTLN